MKSLRKYKSKTNEQKTDQKLTYSRQSIQEINIKLMGVPEREKRENSGSEMIQKNRYIFEYGRQAFLNLKSQPNAEHK